MTHDEAISLIGKRVKYIPAEMSRFAQSVLTEIGVITSVNESVAFVQYVGDTHSKATYFFDLYEIGDSK